MNRQKTSFLVAVSMAIAIGWTGPAPAQPPQPNKLPAASVDGVPITMEEIAALLRQAGPKGAGQTDAQRKENVLEAIGLLIDEQLMQQFLRKYGPKIEAAEVAKKLGELESGLRKEGKTLKDFYRDTSQTEAQIRGNVTAMLQWAGYVQQHLTDGDIKRYYDENKEFFDGVVVRASHIVLRTTPQAAEAEKQSLRIKLLTLRQEIITGRIDFAEAAKKNSLCQSAPNGGDIGFFPRKFAVDENFAKAAFGLKVGEISDVVATEFGLHLIKVTDRKAGTPSDFNAAKIKENVREACMFEMRLGILAEQRKTAKVEINVPVP